MASAKATLDLNIPPDTVWELIGGFGSLPTWLPYIPKSRTTKGGRVRHLDNPDGKKIVEKLEKYDDKGRSYSYSILEAPFPVTDYLATISVRSSHDGKGCHVEWAGDFTPHGISEEEAHKLFQGIFSDGLKALSEHYTSTT